jgi:AraC family transcriptional regulator
MSVEPVRFEDGAPMLMAGLRRVHAEAAAAHGIPMQWLEFNARRPVPGAVEPAVGYGIICGYDAARREMEYMCAQRVASFEDLGAEWQRLRTPPARYAVFEHRGHASTLRQTWAGIHGDWLPRSGLRARQVPDFERYDARFDRATGAGLVEIWFPVETDTDAPFLRGPA